MEPSAVAEPTTAVQDDRRARLVKTFAYYSAFVVLGLAASVFGPTLDGLSRHTHSSIDQISYLFSLRSLGYMGGSILAGRLYDRVKGHPLMASGVFIIALMMFLVPLMPVLLALAGIILVLGVAEGLTDVGGNTLLIWTHRDELKTFMNGLHFFFGFGALLSPIVVGVVLAQTPDFKWAYWLLAALMLPGAVWVARLPSPKPIVTHEDRPVRPVVPLLVGMLAVFMFLYVGAEVSYGGFISKYTLERGLASDASAAFLASGFWGALTAGRLLGIPLSARFSARKILLADLLVVLVGLAVVLAAPGSLFVLWAGTILVGLGMASIFPTVLILAEENMTITGFVNSFFFIGSSMGGVVQPWLIGQLFRPYGPGAMLTVIGISSLLEVGLFAAIWVYTHRLSLRTAH